MTKSRIPLSWLIAGALPAIIGCDKAAADWSACQAATDRKTQIAACTAATEKDPKSAAGIAAADKLHQLDLDDERKRHDDRVAEDTRLLREFRGKASDIADTIDAVDKLSASGNADLADLQLAVAETTVDTYATTDLVQANEYIALSRRVHAARTKLAPLLTRWRYDHPTIADLVARCAAQADEADRILDVMNAALRQRDYVTVNDRLPEYDAATKKWVATFNLFEARDRTDAVLRCRPPKR